MRSLGSALVLCLILPAPQRATILSPAAHAVTLRLETLGPLPAVVHLTSPDTALRVMADSMPGAVRTLTVRTPVLIAVSSEASEVKVATEGNVAVRIIFENGASARERALHAWGRQLLFRRSSDGDLLPQSQALQLLPAK
jgi:hypothetical protein